MPCAYRYKGELFGTNKFKKLTNTIATIPVDEILGIRTKFQYLNNLRNQAHPIKNELSMDDRRYFPNFTHFNLYPILPHFTIPCILTTLCNHPKFSFLVILP